VRDARREGVARIVYGAIKCLRHDQACPDRGRCAKVGLLVRDQENEINDIVRLLDDETRALREALAGLFDLVEKGLLVRNTTNDGHFPSYMAEAVKITKALAAAQALLTPTPGAVRGCTTCRERWAKQGWEGHCPHSLPTP